MSNLRVRAAVSPLRRRFPDAEALPSVGDLISAERPDVPMHCLRPAAIRASAHQFVQAFPGDVMYAVKCNPEPAVLRALHAGGVSHFDCASIAEVALVRQMFPAASIHFMHPVKARSAIREAWARHGVRDFVLDSTEELAKLLHEIAATEVDDELGLIVRLALPKGSAVLDLSGKFGAAPALAAELLRAARPHAMRLGISFHVGSQCLDPLAWRNALALAGEVIRDAGVDVEIVDIGGGFPVEYPDVQPAPLGAFLAEIEAGFERLNLPNARLWAEPGRALVPAAARWWCRCSTAAARRSISTMVYTGRWPTPARSASAIRCGCCVRMARCTLMHRSGSRSTARPATAPTRCAGRSSCPPMSRRATGSRSASSVRMAVACAPRSTVSIALAWLKCATPRWVRWSICLFAWRPDYGGGGATAPGATDPISQSRNSAIFGVSAVVSGATM